MKIEIVVSNPSVGGLQIVVVTDGGNGGAVTIASESHSIQLMPSDWRRILRIIEALSGTD